MYRFLEHTADVFFEAEGETLAEAIEEAARAMAEVSAEDMEVVEEFDMDISAQNLEELVVSTLSNLLGEAEARSLFPAGIKILEIDEKNFRLKAKGYAGKGNPKADIKAVTYHRLFVGKEDGKWKIRILLDV